MKIVIKSTAETPTHTVNPLDKVLIDSKKNSRNMAENGGSGTRAKKDSPKCSKSDELVLRPQPARRITVKGKIARIRPAKPKLRLD